MLICKFGFCPPTPTHVKSLNFSIKYTKNSCFIDEKHLFILDILANLAKLYRTDNCSYNKAKSRMASKA